MRRNLTFFKASLLDIRNEWSWYLLLMLVTPLSTVFFLKMVASDSIGTEVYLTGSIVMCFGTGVFLGLGQTISVYKSTRALDYYLQFSIPRYFIMLTLMVRTIILTLPSVAVLIAINYALSDNHVYLGLPFFLSLFLTSTTLAGIGTLIGILSKNPQVASVLTQVITPVLIYLAPVFYSADLLPLGWRWLTYLLPTTYAADSLKEALFNNGYSFAMLILFFMSIVSVLLSTVVTDWRKR
jgi:ABC-2 type transport system permease protein